MPARLCRCLCSPRQITKKTSFQAKRSEVEEPAVAFAFAVALDFAVALAFLSVIPAGNLLFNHFSRKLHAA